MLDSSHASGHLVTVLARIVAIVALFAPGGFCRAADQPTPKTHQLKPIPKTVAWGYYDASALPVLRIQSGDTVEVQTLITSSPTALQRAFVPPDQIEQALKDIFKDVTDKGPGGHILTGPIFVEGAEAGDTLEVRIKTVQLALPYAYTAFSPRGGFLPEDFPRSKTKIISLDQKRMVGKFGDGVEIPLKPFFGSMGVAPPAELGRVSSAPPGVHAGNLDNKELVAGTTLFIPIHTRGALFSIGDGHAAQGDGEVCITGLETSLTGTLEFIVRKDLKLKWPRAETPSHYIVMGLDKDLTEAAKLATREAIDFLSTQKKLSQDEAYMLASVAVNFRITQVVDGTKGVHGMIPKEIFKEK
ncbi:MAG TPA: acetamidase/formamidase family protein [Gemmata sp.]|nr:acetamidase/formamidase family protein [Gemmata sp.]